LAHIWGDVYEALPLSNGMWNTSNEAKIGTTQCRHNEIYFEMIFRFIFKLTPLWSPTLGGGINPCASAATTHRHKVPHSANKTLMLHQGIPNR